VVKKAKLLPGSKITFIFHNSYYYTYKKVRLNAATTIESLLEEKRVFNPSKEFTAKLYKNLDDIRKYTNAPLTTAIFWGRGC